MGRQKTKLDLVQLVKEIRLLNNRKELYRILKDELGKLGHWKQKPRGNPTKAFSMRGKKYEENI